VSKQKKAAEKRPERKTAGTVAIEKYRPAMNKLSEAEREQLMARAFQTIYSQPENAGRP